MAGGATEADGAGARVYSLQYALPLSQLGLLVERLAAVAQALVGRLLELKFVGGPGRALLGVNADGPVVCANVLWRVSPREMHQLDALERLLVGLGGRPHLGKWHALELPAGSWPQCTRLAAMIARVDPNGRLGGREAFLAACAHPVSTDEEARA